jgi:hypothetical protein
MTAASSEDIFLWPDGAWCYREDAHCMSHRSDDYRVLPFESAEWWSVPDHPDDETFDDNEDYFDEEPEE